MTEPVAPPNALPEPLPGPYPGAGEPAHPGFAGVLVLTDIEVASARGYIDASRAASTRTAYAADWRRADAAVQLDCRQQLCHPARPGADGLRHGARCPAF